MKFSFKDVRATFVPRIRGWYLSFGDRDQIAILTMIVFLGVTLLTWFVVVPSFKYHRINLAEYHQQQVLLNSLLNNQEYVKSAMSSAAQESQGSILSAIDRSANARSIAFQRYEPTKDNGVRLSIENVQFGDLIIWLGELSASHDIYIEQISIEKQSGGGIVNARIDLAP